MFYGRSSVSRGVVVSEGGGFGTLVYEDIVRTQKEAGALALKAGVDVNITYEPAYMGPLIENVQEGRVPIALVDRAVRRVLELKFRLGLFENPYIDVQRATEVVHSQPNQDLALRAGREGIVLLKNDHSLLPLKKNLKSIAVIGPDADNLMNQLGDYSPHKVLQHVISILEGIKAKAGRGAKVVGVRGCGVLGDDKSGFAEAIRAAKGADAAIVVVGENQGQNGVEEKKDPPTDGEGHDVASLDLTGVQEDLVRGNSGDGYADNRGIGEREAALDALDCRACTGNRGGVAARRAGRASGRRRPIWRLQPKRPSGYNNSAPRRPATGLLQLQTRQRVLDTRRKARLCGYAGDAALPFWLRPELYDVMSTATFASNHRR